MGLGGGECQEERAADIHRYRQVVPTPQTPLQGPPPAPGGFHAVIAASASRRDVGIGTGFCVARST